MVYMWLGDLSKQFNFDIKATFHKEIYKKYNAEELEDVENAVITEFENVPDYDKRAELLSNVLDNRFTIRDFAGHLMVPYFEKMAEFIEFETDLSKKVARGIAAYLDDYMRLFMEDGLKMENQNYVRYQRMKESMMKKLFDLYNRYGDDFITESMDFADFWDVPWKKDVEHLFVHTLLALEREGLMKIDYFWTVDLDKNPETWPKKGNETIKANITLMEAFLDEVKNSDYITSLDKPLSPKKSSKQEDAPRLKFDPVKSALFIGSTEVEVRNHSNQYELLKIVFEDSKEAFREWFYSKIAEQYEPSHQPNEKRFENAAYQLNNKIIRDTGLRDVMEVKKRSVIFNKKYEGKT